MEYYLISGRPQDGSRGAEVYNLAFQFWMSFWSDVFKKITEGERPDPEHFSRQDKISVILHENKVAALHLYSFFDLNHPETRKHSYFTSSFTEKSLQALDEKCVRSAMTFEYLSVAPEWQSRKNGVSLALAIVSLGVRVFTRSQADMLLGVCRIDVGVAKIGYETGGIPLDRNVILHDVPCDIIGVPKGKERFPNAQAENALAEKLWNQKIEIPHHGILSTPSTETIAHGL